MASAAFLLGRGREDQEESPFLQIDKLLYRELERLQELYGKLLERGDWWDGGPSGFFNRVWGLNEESKNFLHFLM